MSKDFISENADDFGIATEEQPNSFAVEAAISQNLQANARHERHLRTSVGIGMLALAGATTAAIAWGVTHDDKVTHELPFVKIAQTVVEDVDTGLAATGAVLLPASIGTIGVVKIRSRRNAQIRNIDRASSQELSDDGKDKTGIVHCALRAAAAGSVPGIAVAAVGVAGLMAGLGQEISTGPDRPVDAMLNAAPGDNMVVQYSGAMPMVQSALPRSLTHNITLEATQRDVSATSINLDLAQMTYNGKDFSALVTGTEQPNKSPLLDDKNTCKDVPIAVDSAAGIPVDAKVNINGIDAHVVSTVENMSAINRIGIVADRETVASCFEQDKNAPDHAVVLNTNTKTAKEIVTAADEGIHAPAVVISKEQYKQNSEEFWKANVKPITNVMALLSGLLSFVSMGGIMSARLMRNRREWASKLASGVSEKHLRSTELLRATKDGVVASAVGTTIAVAGAPLVNVLESGLKVGMDMRSILVGCSVGLIGSIGGAWQKVRRPRKTINPAESTRI